ncbi:MAG: guanitoxin biosynthesis MBL fold metallo-hydrolase GntH [Myxococcota bacterium]|nr:guanitoxin biosynthesis MBL fold metallo-hydrolase GntH [Myxococcota bacterium]
MRKRLSGFILGSLTTVTLIMLLGAGGKVTSPTGTAPDRYVYYPGTEELAADEMRVIACGTGMPAARHKQAAACFLVELGNGDKFFFDLGTGAMANVAALMIPYDFLDKLFISHLHTDHWGDLAALWAGGWTAGRTGPLKVWGPNGQTEDFGTKFAVEHFLLAYNWDKKSREATLANAPGQIEVTEFDYRGVNKVIYQANGATIRSWPAIHIADGAVSFALEWNGLKFVFSGDTGPNKWFVEHAKGGDLVVHESFFTPTQFVELYGRDPAATVNVTTVLHTSPQAFGKIMSAVRPRHAVAYHVFNDEETRYEVYEAIRQTYDGPLSLATDMMVWNVTKDEIKVRMAEATESAYSVAGPRTVPPPEPGVDPLMYYSKETLNGRWNVDDVQKEMVDEFKKKYGLD